MTEQRKTRRPARTLLSLMACVFAAAGLLAVALSATIWSPAQGVSSSQADILDLLGTPPSSERRFERALKQLGHEPPRAFDINGNTVYFSVHHIDKSPQEVLRRYQQAFVHQQLNTRAYLNRSEADTQQGRLDMLTGGIVPMEITPDYISMGGGVTDNFAQNADQLARLTRDLAQGTRDRQFRAYRHIEAFREPRSRFTTVVASWSDDQFDYRRMLVSSSVSGQAGDPSIPACPGCVRLQRFEDLDPKRDYVEHIFTGPVEFNKTVAFYARALRARGWQPVPTADLLHDARRMEMAVPDVEFRQYYRDGHQLNLMIYLNERYETVAHLTLFDN